MKPDVFYLSVLLTATYSYTSAVQVKPQSKDSDEDMKKTNKSDAALPGSGTPENMTYVIQGYKQEQQVALIIDALEKLGILSTKKYNCYSLKKITRYSISGKKEEVLVGVTMEFKEVYEPKGQSRTSTADSRTTSTRRPRIKGKKKCIPKSRSKPSLNGEKDSHHSQSVDCLISSETDMDIDIDVHRDNNTSGNRTFAEAGNQEGGQNASGTLKDRSSEVETNHSGGLSRTQMMVITTCSVVIGVFFIVAFILRLRNYIKRLREEQATARRPTFRSCSMALRGSSNHSEDSQCKDTNVNKDQEKAGNVYLQMEDKDSQDGLDSIPVSPRIANQEHRPLLQVTSLSAPASPAVTRNTFDNLGKSESPHDQAQDNRSDSSVNEESEEEQLKASNPLQAQSQERLLDFGANKNAPEERLLDFGGKNMPPNRKVKCEKLQGKECGGTPDIVVPPSGHTQELALNTQANTGLTQSDSSITSNNPSYRYGNQSEYTGHDDYGNYAYTPGDYTPENQSAENNAGYVQEAQGLAEDSSQPSNPSSSTSSLNGATAGGNHYLPDLHPACEQNFHNPAYDLTPQGDSLVPEQGLHIPSGIPAIRVSSPCGTLTMDSSRELMQKGGTDSVNHTSPAYNVQENSSNPHSVDENTGSHMPLLTNDNKSTPFVQDRHKMEENDAPECDDDERTLLLATFDDLEPTFV